MKKLHFVFPVLILLLFFISCSKNGSEPAETRIDLIAKAKEYFNSEVIGQTVKSRRDLIPAKVQSVQWEKATEHPLLRTKNVVVVPLTLNGTYTAKYGSTAPASKVHSLLFLYKNSREQFQAEVVTYIPAVGGTTRSSGKFTGHIMVEDWRGNYVNTFKYTSGARTRLKPVRSQAYARCDTYYWEQCVSYAEYTYCQTIGSETICYETDDQDGSEIIDESGGGGGPLPDYGGGGAFNPEDEALAEITGTDCKSFTFVATTPLWQEAALAKIKLKWVWSGTAGPGTTIIREPTIPTIVFGLPTAYGNGTEVTPGAAAKIAAQAVDDAKSIIFRKYRSNPIMPSDAIVIQDFIDQIHLQMVLRGGTAGRVGTGSALIITRDEQRSFFNSRDCE